MTHPYPTEEAQKREISPEQWNLLCDHVFPNAKFPKSILEAWDFAKVKGLDVFKAHLAIVTQGRFENGKWVNFEAIWPTLKALTYSAHRTGLYAGLDPIKYGPKLAHVFEGSVRNNRTQRNEPVKKEVMAPEWVSVTVYRIVHGTRCPFPATVFFNEIVSKGAGGIPAKNWLEKPTFMLEKCARAAALRMAFPECDETADEMDGKSLNDTSDIVTFPNHNESDGSEGSKKQEENPPQDGFPEDPTDDCESFGHMNVKWLTWLHGTLQNAVNNGTYDQAWSYVQTSMEPQYHNLAKSLLDASQEISNSPAIAKIGPWLDRAINALPGSNDPACKNAFEQADKGQITKDVANAIAHVLSFHAACIEQNAIAA